jgi:hypothetical protein
VRRKKHRTTEEPCSDTSVILFADILVPLRSAALVAASRAITTANTTSLHAISSANCTSMAFLHRRERQARSLLPLPPPCRRHPHQASARLQIRPPPCRPSRPPQRPGVCRRTIRRACCGSQMQRLKDMVSALTRCFILWRDFTWNRVG